MPTYERHQLARDIQAFFSGVPQEQPRPYPYGFYFYDVLMYRLEGRKGDVR